MRTMCLKGHNSADAAAQEPEETLVTVTRQGATKERRDCYLSDRSWELLLALLDMLSGED